MKYNNCITSCDTKAYIPQMNTLNLADYPHIKESDLFRALRHLPKLSVNGPWVAGGALWRTINKEPLENCDIDMFFQSQKQYEETVLRMNSLPTVNNVVKETKNRWNRVYKFHVHEKKTFDKTFEVQLINMNFHPNIESLFKSFDLTVCQFGYDGENLHCGLTSLDDLTKKQIRFHNLGLPKSMFKHLHKYLSNGFTISSEETRQLAYRLMESNCWRRTDAPDYDDDKNEKEVASKYRSPFATGEWEGYGYASTARTGAAVAANAPVVEQEDEMEIDPATLAPRPRRRARREERIENGGRRNRRVVGEAAPLQANTGEWILPAGNANAMWGFAPVAPQEMPQWAPVNAAPQPAVPADPIIQEVAPADPAPVNPVGFQPINEQPIQRAYNPADPVNDADEDDGGWEGFGYAARFERARQMPIVDAPEPAPAQPGGVRPMNNQREDVIRQMGRQVGGENVARRVLNQLEREGLDRVPQGVNVNEHFDRAAVRAEELVAQYQNEAREAEQRVQHQINEVRRNEAVQGNAVYRPAVQNAAQAFDRLFAAPEIQPQNEAANLAAEQEIADDAIRHIDNGHDFDGGLL